MSSNTFDKEKNKFKVSSERKVKVPAHSKKVSLKSLDVLRVDNLLIKLEQKWFEQFPRGRDAPLSSTSSVTPDLKIEAHSIHLEDIKRYQKFQEKRKEKADFIWMQTILHTGTLPDKISAHTLFIQDSPVHNVSSVDILVSMVNPKGKRECLMAMDCLKDLFLCNLLIEGKKLKTFAQHSVEELDKLPAGHLMARKRTLLLWYFEDQLKALYTKFIKNLQLVSHDSVEKMKQKAVTVMYELLKNNPEQEQYLLENLVNKIGDPIPKVGSHVCHLLGRLVEHHPTMMAVVVQEVERVLFRTNIGERAKYYCLCFLNQLILSHEYSNIANHLISIYFGEFKMCVKKGEVNSKMMSALLTGVARAYPYAKLSSNVIMEQLDAMYHLVHMVSFNISIQALMLIFQVLDSKDSVSDRFYSALYRKLLDPAISTSSRQSMLLNLMYRALKKDVAQARVKAFVKRLLQISLYQAPNLQCGILLLISELTKTHSALFEHQPAVMFSDDSDGDEHFEDITEYEDSMNEIISEGKDGKKSFVETESTEAPNRSSWIHRQNHQQYKNTEKFYSPQNRNPLHCGAEYCNFWELQYLKKSFHPSVSFFAGQISNSTQINYASDPLQDFTTIRFLDRFVYRNPKKKTGTKADIHRKIFGGRKLHKESKLQHVSITSDEYIHQNEDQVPSEEKFIYKYLQKRSINCKKGGTADSDIESVNSEEFETLLNAIHPEDEGKDTLDFAKELTLCKQKQRKSVENDDNDLEALDSDFEEINFENDDEFHKAFVDEDDEIGPDIVYEDLSSENFVDFSPKDLLHKDKNQKLMSKKRSKKQKFDNEDLFASADQFSTFLESNADFKTDTISSEAFMNTDKAAAKQLAWENERDQYVRGVDWKSRKSNKFKRFSKKRKYVS